jgi:hypothetical protein
MIQNGWLNWNNLMKAILEFNLPDDNYEHMRAVHCNQAWHSLYEIDSMCRNLLKHGTDDYTTVEQLAQAIRIEAGNALHQVEE